MSAARPRVVIVGGGFAGLEAAKGLRRVDADVVLVDRQNHHLFQPLLYQVATAGLSPAHIAAPIRRVLRRNTLAHVALAEVTDVDLEGRRIEIADAGLEVNERDWLEYDYLVLATGMRNWYFGNDSWERDAPGLKSINDALEIRNRFLSAFEVAEYEADEGAQRAALTFVIIGGGPTGVEMAGTMIEIARKSIPRDFRFADTQAARVVLVEAGSRLLAGFPEKCSRDALAQLRAMGVEVLLESRVTGVDDRGVAIGDDRIDSLCVIWSAGVRASELGEASGVETDSIGRVVVEPDLSLPEHPEVFAVGDLAHVEDERRGEPVPGMAPGAMQMGRYVARVIRKEIGETSRPDSESRDPFRYVHKGMLATIGRSRAVAALGRWQFKGYFAWALWLVVHILFLIDFRNRAIVLFEWTYQYFFYDRGARLITRLRAHRLREVRGADDGPRSS